MFFMEVIERNPTLHLESHFIRMYTLDEFELSKTVK